MRDCLSFSTRGGEGSLELEVTREVELLGEELLVSLFEILSLPLFYQEREKERATN